MLHNLEEAKYFKSMMDMMEEIQSAKESAANALFHHQIQDLKHQTIQNEKFGKKVNKFRARSLSKLVKILADCVDKEIFDQEDEN